MADDGDDSAVVLSEHYDPAGSESVSMHVVRLVAIASDRDPTEVGLLERSVDTEALDTLVHRNVTADGGGSVAVSFDYEGYQVDIDADGLITLSDGAG